MNKKGQSLVSFVLMLPIIIFFLAFFIDSMMAVMAKEKLEGMIKSNLDVVLKDNIRDTAKIKKVLEENDQNVKMDIKVENDILMISASSAKKNLFGNIFKINIVPMKVNYCGNYLTREIKKDCEMIKWKI